MKGLVIGKGEVGQALWYILEKYHETYIKDIEPLDLTDVEILHICYPDQNNFQEITQAYVKAYKPKLTIIHSSISVGTAENCGEGIVYSPVRGRHQGSTEKFAKEILSFPKFVAGGTDQDQRLACDYLETAGFKVQFWDNMQDLEFVKLISNVHMGLEIAWRQEVERMLKYFKIHSFIYHLWEKTYQQGYLELDQPHMMRPMMSPKPIGGHCILPCTEILKKQFDSPLFDFILASNEKAKLEVK